VCALSVSGTNAGQALYEETAAMRAACGDAKLKSILAIGELGSMDNVLRASLVCMMAGSDTIKVGHSVSSRQSHVIGCLSETKGSAEEKLTRTDLDGQGGRQCDI
jgi:deoxyribose-phosphate aldolase